MDKKGTKRIDDVLITWPRLKSTKKLLMDIIGQKENLKDIQYCCSDHWTKTGNYLGKNFKIPLFYFIVVYNMQIALIHVKCLVIELTLPRDSKKNQYSFKALG